MLNVYKASAGSGKTFTLAYEYIKLLLGYKDESGIFRLNFSEKEYHRHILAVTFTNKATDEMKQRIVSELAALSGIRVNHDSPYLPRLCKLFDATETKIREAAKRALIYLLHDFSYFNISTIDSFFQNILRTFAREAEVPYNYDIELRDDYAVKVGINDLLSSLSRNSGKDNRKLISWLSQYMRDQVNKNSSWNIFKESAFDSGTSLYSLAKYLSTETFKFYRQELENYLLDKYKISEFQNILHKEIDECNDKIRASAREFEKYIQSIGLSLDYVSTKGSIYGFRKIIEKDNLELPQSFYNASEKTDTWFLKSKIKGIALSFDSIEHICRIAQKIIDTEIVRNTYDAMHENIYALGLLGDISRHVFKFRSENNLILLSDTNDLLRRIINEEDTPFIYERVGMTLKHFLIDEFQDTSRLQWQNIKPLLRESLSHNNENLIIGDEKQSIYRFRNADPYLLEKQVFLDFKDNVALHGDNLVSNTNWRSSENIVKFNNTLFSALSQNMGLENTYSNVVQLISPRNVGSGGHIKIEFIKRTEDKTWTDISLEKLPEVIENFIMQGYSQKEIAILVNKKSEGSAVIERILEYTKQNHSSDIRIISDESLLLKSSPTIRLIISILRYIDNIPQDSVKSKINIIPVLLKHYENNLNKGCTPTKSLELAFNTLKAEENGEILQQFNSIPESSIISVTEQIINKYVSNLSCAEDAPYIYAFQDIIINYSNRNIPTIHSFLKWWDANSFSVNSPASMDAINIMTIHKSKGLEFPCVIIPFCNWEIDPGNGLLWVNPKFCDSFDQSIPPPIVPVKFGKRLLSTAFADEYLKTNRENSIDTLNKTYVAFTRASKNMTIFMPDEPKEGYISEPILNIIESTDGNICHNIENAANARNVTIPLKLYFDNNIFEIGTETHVANKITNPEDSIIMCDYHTHGNITGLRFSIPDTIETPRSKGILLHKILSMVRYERDIQDVIKICRNKGLIMEDNAGEVNGIFENIFKNDEVRSWFSKDVRILNERSLVKNNDISRPDRIVITPEKKVYIIDYKFGEKHLASYEKQVLKYISIIKEAGFESVTGKIWYPIENVIRTITQ